MKLSDKIYHCRKKAGLSQEALAERIGVSRQAISKWETGEAAPEIAKLPLLAREFSVKADWLLDDSAEPETDGTEADEAQGGAEDYASADSPEAAYGHPYAEEGRVGADSTGASAYPEWIDRLPGFLGRMLKKYGWLFGVRIAISGAIFTAMGFVAQAMFSSMNRMANDSFESIGNMFGSGGSTIFYDNAGNVIDPSSLGIDVSQFGVTGGSPFGFSNFTASASMSEPFDIMCSFIIVVGLMLLIGGSLLAWYLKKKGQESLNKG